MDILRSLIGINSVSGSEGEIVACIKKYLQNLSFTPITIGDNLLVKIKGESQNKALIFNAHVDTVAIGDKTSWKTPPLEGVVKNDKMYGLGASDEKATIATLLYLARALSIRKPACDVYLTFVAREEIDGSGTKEVLEWFEKHERKKYKAVAGILGEPTGLSEIEIAHKGNIFLTITTKGQSGHGSAPSKIKTHAVLEMIEIVHKLKRLETTWKEKYSDPILGSPTIGLLTSISAGDSTSPNKFPDTCKATFDVRTTPPLHNQAKKEIQTIITPATVEYTYTPVSYGYTEGKEKIVEITKQVTNATIVASSWSNDMCFFTEKNIPAVVLGPGERETIHKANEYCFVEKIDTCVQYYHQMIEEF